MRRSASPSGSPLRWGVTRLMRSLVFGVSTTDPATFVGLSVFLIVVAGLASYLPARQAAKTDPVVALRAD